MSDNEFERQKSIENGFSNNDDVIKISKYSYKI